MSAGLHLLQTRPDARLLAYATDEDGSERYVIHIKDLASGVSTTDLVANTSGSVVWSADGATLFYVELNEKLRPYRVKAHRLGTDAAADRTVYTEDDPAFFVGIGLTQSRRFVVVTAGSHVTREVRLIPFQGARKVFGFNGKVMGDL